MFYFCHRSILVSGIYISNEPCDRSLFIGFDWLLRMHVQEIHATLFDWPTIIETETEYCKGPFINISRIATIDYSCILHIMHTEEYGWGDTLCAWCKRTDIDKFK